MRRLRPANPAIALAIAAVCGAASGADPPADPAATQPPAQPPAPLYRDLPESRPRPAVANPSADDSQGDSTAEPTAPEVAPQPLAPEIESVVSESLGRLGRRDRPVAVQGLLLYDPNTRDESGRRLAANVAVRLASLASVYRRTLDPPGPSRRPGVETLVVVLNASRNEFELTEATLFNQAPLPSRLATTQSIEVGGVAVPFIDAWRDPDEATFRSATGRAIAMALVDARYRLTGPGSLPAWFREGLASQLMAMHVEPDALEPVLRQSGLAYLRNGGSARTALSLPADDPAWIDLTGPAQGVAFLAVQRLAEGDPQGLDRFLQAVRGGEAAEAAFRRVFKASPLTFAATLERHHAVND